MQYEDRASPYRPFKYPPDYSLAKLHQKASMPGEEDPLQLACPCCDQPIKRPFDSWWNRSVIRDFKKYGGAIVCYFGLTKLYCLSMVLVLAIYGVYLQYLSWVYCQNLIEGDFKKQVCSKLFGVWIVTNEDLYKIIELQGDRDVLVRFSVLRSVVFVILLLTNAAALYLIQFYKIRYPDKINVSDFALLFKNVVDHDVEHLLSQLRKQFGYFEVQEAFILKQLEPFYSVYQQKLEVYYSCRNEENPKKIPKLRKKLQKAERQCSRHQGEFEKDVGRAIIVFESTQIRDKILQKYKIGALARVRMIFRDKQDSSNRVFCEQCPRPDEIYWKNIGIDERDQQKLRLKSLGLYFVILSLSVVVLLLLSTIIYFQKLSGPVRALIQNVSLIIVAATMVCFRLLMDKITDMHFPGTNSSRTMSIVIKTVMLHFIFYLWLPSLYLNLFDKVRGPVLNLMSNQAIATVVTQIILTSIDLFFCCWKRNRPNIENEDKPPGCQKMLHQKVQFPRFPFEFKMIILYKFWSLITFFAFHTPMVLVFIFVGLLFHYAKDKYNLYFHYRYEMLNSKIQFNFLRIYTNLFTVYMYVVFVFTQRNPIEYIIGAVVTVVALAVQLLYFRKLHVKDPDEEEEKLLHLGRAFPDANGSFYQAKYNNFIDSIRSESLDLEIRHYLAGQSFIQSEESYSINTDKIL